KKNNALDFDDLIFKTLVLFDKDKELIDDDLCPLKIEYRNAEYNYQTFLGNGGGSYNAEFLSIQASKSAERLRQVAERAHYFIVY
ncbi:MAG: hypothetical protein IIT37_07135, partial [Bacteroidales bacterium]|nr:hypothetical protein [Bacteroidales bacterium]